jgi:RHS repeat-associated protein
MGTITDYTYDALDQKLSATVHLDGEDLVHEWTYTGDHQVKTEADPNRNVTTHEYNGLGWRSSSTLGGEVTHYAYGGNSARTIWDDPKPTLVTDPRGVETSHVYDALRHEVSSTITDGGTTTTVYDEVGNPVSVTDPLNRVTTTQFDAMDRPVLVTFPDSLTRQTDYDSLGKVIRLKDELNRETWTTYDAAGRPVQVMAPAVTAPDGSTVHPTVTTFYDAASRPVAVQDALGRETNTEFDQRGRPTKVTSPPAYDALTQTTRRAEVNTIYDLLGRVTSVTDAYGQTTTKVYDRASRLLETHLPAVPINGGAAAATVVRSEYDHNGNVIHAFDAANHETVNEYDAHNRLTKTTDSEGQVTEFGYDLSGNRNSVKDANLHTTAWAYDGMKRVLTETAPNGVVLVTNTYNALNKTGSTDALGRVITYDYDLRNRLLHMYEPGNTRAYSYDNGGRLLSVTETADATAAVSYTYDDLDRVLTETSRGLTHSYTYDLVGNRVGANYATGRQVTTSYDNLNRPESMVDDGRTTQWLYDVGGRCRLQYDANGTVVHNSYDAQGRLADRSQTYGSSTRATFAWQHDKVGNVTRQEEDFGSGSRITEMGYDSVSRLLSETVMAGSDVDESVYTYDAVSNRASLVKIHNGATQTSTTYVYNSLNQLTDWTEKDGSGATLRDATLHYDAVGNRTSQTIAPASGGEQDTAYGWDVLNRLTSVSLPNGQTHTYAYDYRTRRIARTEGASTTALSFSGGLSTAEYAVANPQSAIPDPQSTSVEFQRGPDLGGGVGGLLYSLRGGTARFNLSNARGDVVSQTDSSGGLTWQASYEAYGKRPVESGANADRQRANTKEEDPTGLLNEGFRYRDLETGVWLSRDPAGFVDGPNLYAYVRQNPWTKFDPEGLDEKNPSFGEIVSNAVDRFEGWVARGVIGTWLNSDSKIAQAAVDNFTDSIANPINEIAKTRDDELHIRPFGTDPHGSASDAAEVQTLMVTGMLALDELSQGSSKLRTRDADGATAPRGSGAKPEATAKEAQIESTAKTATIEPYNRTKHYGKTPTSADREHFGAGDDEVVNHEPPLVKRYHEGDPARGEKPGKYSTPEERKASANDRTRMNLQPEKESQQQGAEMSRYSREQNKKLQQDNP